MSSWHIPKYFCYGTSTGTSVPTFFSVTLSSLDIWICGKRTTSWHVETQPQWIVLNWLASFFWRLNKFSQGSSRKCAHHLCPYLKVQLYSSTLIGVKNFGCTKRTLVGAQKYESNWIMSPGIGVYIKSVSNHHLVYMYIFLPADRPSKSPGMRIGWCRPLVPRRTYRPGAGPVDSVVDMGIGRFTPWN